MFLFNSLKIFLVISIGLLPPTVAQVRDYPSPYRPDSLDLNGDRDEIDGWDEAAFARLSIEDPILKRAYSMMFGSAVNPNLHFSRPELNAAAADIRKRGNLVTPMLIKLMHENEETGFECNVLTHIAAVGTVDVTPYLEYARHVLRERTWTMSAGLAGCAASLIAKHGTQEDIELLKWVMETRPYVEDAVTRKLDELNRRLNLPKQEPRLVLRGKTAGNEPPDRDSQRDQKQKSIVTAENEKDSTRWVVWFLAVLVLGGVFRLMRKERK